MSNTYLLTFVVVPLDSVNALVRRAADTTHIEYVQGYGQSRQSDLADLSERTAIVYTLGSSLETAPPGHPQTPAAGNVPTLLNPPLFE